MGIKSREENLALVNRSGDGEVFMEPQPRGYQCGDQHRGSAVKVFTPSC